MQTMKSNLFYCRITRHVSGVTAPIIRSAKNCNRSHLYLLSKEFVTNKFLRYLIPQNFVDVLMYHYPLLSEVNNLTHNFVSSFKLILVFHSMTCTGGCG